MVLIGGRLKPDKVLRKALLSVYVPEPSPISSGYTVPRGRSAFLRLTFANANTDRAVHFYIPAQGLRQALSCRAYDSTRPPVRPIDPSWGVF